MVNNSKRIKKPITLRNENIFTKILTVLLFVHLWGIYLIPEVLVIFIFFCHFLFFIMCIYRASPPPQKKR